MNVYSDVRAAAGRPLNVSPRIMTCLAALTAWFAVVNSAFAQSAYNLEVLADNPVYYWTFDETGGHALNYGSASGSANTFSLGSSTIRGTGATSGGGGTLGNSVTAANVPGAGGMLLTNGGLNGGGFSKYAVEAWISFDGTGNTYLMDNYANQPALISNFVGSQFELFGGGSRTSSVGTGPTLPLNTWTHVVLGVDSTTSAHEVYFDGALVGSYSGYGTAWGGASTLTSLGGTAFNGGLQASNSSFDELAIYDLSSVASGASFTSAVADISDHYNAAGGVTAAAKTPLPYTYSYDANTTANVLLAGDSATSGGTEYTAPERLNDGLITPSGVNGAFGWVVGNNGVIYGLDGTGEPQPGIVIDLGSETDLDSLEIEYFVRPGSGVQAPSALDITVDGEALPTYTDFLNTIPPSDNYSVNKLAIVDLTGYSGQFLELDFRNGTGTQGGIGFWTGLSEIRVFEAIPQAVPEPSGVAMWGLLGLVMAGFVAIRSARSMRRRPAA